MIRSLMWAAFRVWAISICKQGAASICPSTAQLPEWLGACGKGMPPIAWGPERCYIVMLNMLVMVMIKDLVWPLCMYVCMMAMMVMVTVMMMMYDVRCMMYDVRRMM